MNVDHESKNTLLNALDKLKQIGYVEDNSNPTQELIINFLNSTAEELGKLGNGLTRQEADAVLKATKILKGGAASLLADFTGKKDQNDSEYNNDEMSIPTEEADFNETVID